MGDRALTRAPARALLVVAAVALAACGVDDPRDRAGGAEPARATTFAVELVPEGFELIAAGEGERTQEWGNDSAGTDEPSLVVGNGEQRVVIHAFGYEGYQGGFDQGAFKGSEQDRWITEARDLGGDLGIKATSADVDRALLVDVGGRVVAPGDRMNAPTVEPLPDGWSVVGHSDADVLLAIGSAGGAPDSYGAWWSSPEGSQPSPEMRLTVSSVRGDTAELDAWRGRLPNPILWHGDAVGTTASVNGRDAVFVAVEEGEGGTMNVVLTRMEDGSLLVVTSLPGASVRVTNRNGTATAPLQLLPDDSSRVAVVFTDIPKGFSVPGCSGVSLPGVDDSEDVEIIDVDILDESGSFLGCTPSIVTPPDSPELRVG